MLFSNRAAHGAIFQIVPTARSFTVAAFAMAAPESVNRKAAVTKPSALDCAGPMAEGRGAGENPVKKWRRSEASVGPMAEEIGVFSTVVNADRIANTSIFVNAISNCALTKQ